MIKYIAAPLICALIGWLTNYIAIRMLFHPRRPVKVLFWTWQGIFPKRQRELAKNLGELVEQELVNHQDIKEVISDPEFIRKLRNHIEFYVDSFIQKKLTSIHPMLASVLKGRALEKIKEMIVQEVERFIPDMIEQAAEELESRLRFSHIVQEKIESFSMEKLETVIFSILKKELWFVEIIGGVLGLLIGTIQAAIFFYF